MLPSFGIEKSILVSAKREESKKWNLLTETLHVKNDSFKIKLNKKKSSLKNPSYSKEMKNKQKAMTKCIFKSSPRKLFNW